MAKKSRTDVASGSNSTANGKSKDGRPASMVLSNGFIAVPLSIASSSSSGKHAATHWIYARKHNTASSSSSRRSKADLLTGDEGERTMFVANLPVDVDEASVRQMFSKVGGVSQVKFRRQVGVVEADEEDEREEKGLGESSDEEDQAEQEGEHHQLAMTTQGGKKGKGKKSAGQHKTSKVPRIVALPSMDPRTTQEGGHAFLSTSSSAHVVFLDSGSLQRAMDLVVKAGLTYHPTPTAPTGLSYLLAQHHLCRPALASIQTWANSAISLYTYRRAHPLPRRIGVRGVTLGPTGELLDEDGFIIVQRTSGKYGRAGASADSGGSVGVAKANFKENDRKKSTGLEDFYRFQLRERKREELAGLRRRFEEDKAKVEKLKAGRRFKPY